MPEGHPIPQGYLDLLRLEWARPLADLGSIPAGTEMIISAQRTYVDTTVEELSFFKSPAPDIASGEAEWFLTRDGERPSPVVVFGACTPGAVHLARGVIKANVGFNYAEMTMFRSSEDAPQGLLKRELPLPESLDPHFLIMCEQIGQVVVGIDEQLYWRMPASYYETGPVQGVQWSVEGFSGRFTGGDAAGS